MVWFGISWWWDINNCTLYCQIVMVGNPGATRWQAASHSALSMIDTWERPCQQPVCCISQYLAIFINNYLRHKYRVHFGVELEVLQNFQSFGLWGWSIKVRSEKARWTHVIYTCNISPGWHVTALKQTIIINDTRFGVCRLLGLDISLEKYIPNIRNGYWSFISW